MKDRFMYDVAIIGGSFAGLTAALQLARASRSILVIDSGRPRNRISPAAHGVAGWSEHVTLFAAGDVARALPNINFALADGAQAAIGCHASLLFPDFVPPLEITP